MTAIYKIESPTKPGGYPIIGEGETLEEALKNFTRAEKKDREIRDLLKEIPYNQVKVRNAFNTLKQAMIADSPSERGSYAHSWHCNIVMSIIDAGLGSYVGNNEALQIANKAASKFMKSCFGVDTKR